MLRSFRLLPLAAAFLAAAAAAQSPPPAATGAAGPVPAAPLSYRSPLAGYQAFTDEKPIPWREANDTVGRIGGWRAYARESAAPPASAPSPSGAPAGDAPPAGSGHGDHHH